MALKTFRASANLPGEIEEILAARIREEKYPSISAYLVGLVLFDLYSRRPHWLTSSLMREPQWIRDEVITEIVRDFDKREEKGEGWFEKRIAELVQERRAKEEHEVRAD